MDNFQKIAAGGGLLLMLGRTLLGSGWHGLDYVILLVLVAVFLLVPAALHLLGDWAELRYLYLPAAFAFAAALLVPQGWIAGMLVLPWAAFGFWGLRKNILKMSGRIAPDVCPDNGTGNGTGNSFRFGNSFFLLPVIVRFSAYLFLIVAAAWAFFYVTETAFLGFDPVISLLTVAHFHYAGFLLSGVVYGMGRRDPGRSVRLVSWLVLLGVPAVALGITASKFSLPTWIEACSTLIMVVGGTGVSLWHFWNYRRYSFIGLLGALLLFGGMILALLYGIRAFIDFPLEIQFMYRWHGSMNAVGVGLLVLVAGNSESGTT